MNQTIVPTDTVPASPPAKPDALQQFTASVLALLKKHGIASVTAEYCGSSDSGQIETVYAVDAQDQFVAIATAAAITLGEGDRTRTFTSLRDLLSDFAWSCVCRHHDGFWYGAGGEGNIHINVATGRVKIDHIERFIGSDSSETEV